MTVRRFYSSILGLNLLWIVWFPWLRSHRTQLVPGAPTVEERQEAQDKKELGDEAIASDKSRSIRANRYFTLINYCNYHALNLHPVIITSVTSVLYGNRRNRVGWLKPWCVGMSVEVPYNTPLMYPTITILFNITQIITSILWSLTFVQGCMWSSDLGPLNILLINSCTNIVSHKRFWHLLTHPASKRIQRELLNGKYITSPANLGHRLWLRAMYAFSYRSDHHLHNFPC